MKRLWSTQELTEHWALAPEDLALSEAQSRVGIALGDEGGARLLAHLSMPASAATVAGDRARDAAGAHNGAQVRRGRELSGPYRVWPEAEHSRSVRAAPGAAPGRG